MRVPLGDRHDQTEIGLDQRVRRPLGLRLSAGDLLERSPHGLGCLLQLLREMSTYGPSVVQLPQRASARCSREPDPRGPWAKPALDDVDLSLCRLDRGCGGRESLDEVAPGRATECDAAHQLGHARARAPHVPPSSPSDALMARGDLLQGRVTRLDVGPRRLDRADLPDHVTCAYREPGGGYLPVVMRDEAPNEVFVVPQRVAQSNDLLHEAGGLRDRDHDRAVAAFNPFASATSSSRVNSGTRLMSARYSRTTSLDVSGLPVDRSASSASVREEDVPSRSSDSASTSMPASRHRLSRSSNARDVTSTGRRASISSRSR